MANDEKNDAGVTGAQAKVLASSLAEPVPILLDVATSQGILTQEDAQQMVDSTLDKSLPRNWSDTRKLLVIVVISGMSFIV